MSHQVAFYFRNGWLFSPEYAFKKITPLTGLRVKIHEGDFSCPSRNLIQNQVEPLKKRVPADREVGHLAGTGKTWMYPGEAIT